MCSKHGQDQIDVLRNHNAELKQPTVYACINTIGLESVMPIEVSLQVQTTYFFPLCLQESRNDESKALN